MSAAVQPIISPNRDEMRAHVEHLFGGFLDGYQDGLVELAWTKTQPNEKGIYALTNARLFKTDCLDELVDEAVKLNSQPMCNVYIGAWLRHPDTAPFARTEDSDAWVMTAAYADLDDEGATAKATEIYKGKKSRPTWVTMTGTKPHNRAQLWWRLEEPITDHERGRALISGLTAALGGDHSICNPGRVMRLAGSLAWATKPGRQIELTSHVPIKKPDANLYAVEYLERQFPPVHTIGASQSTVSKRALQAVSAPTGNGLSRAKIEDGREGYMRDTTLAVLGEYIGEYGSTPSIDELFELCWPQYSQNVDFSRPGRGPDELRDKCRYTLQRFEAGKIAGARTLDDVIARYEQKRNAREQAELPKAKLPEPARQDKSIKTVSFLTLLTEKVEEEPDYISPDFAGPGTFALIAGPPKAQKSFLLQEILVAAATGGSFLSGAFKCERPLRVFYLQAEMNRKLLRRRARAFHMFSPAEKDMLSRNLIVSERFHMLLNEAGVQTAIATIKAAFPTEPPDIIAIDPLANVFDQENESDNAQMMRFIQSRIEAVRQKVNPLACIIMVHHATKKSSDDMSRDPFVAIRGAGALRGYYDSAIVIYRANEDSKQRKIHFELRSGESPEPMTVELKDGRFYAATPTSGITKDDARKILKAIDEAWRANEPWSPHERSKNEGRHAATNAGKLFSMNPKVVQALIGEWMVNRVITFRQRERVKGQDFFRPAGLQVIGSLD